MAPGVPGVNPNSEPSQSAETAVGHWIILNHIESYEIILNHIESYWIILNHHQPVVGDSSWHPHSWCYRAIGPLAFPVPGIIFAGKPSFPVWDTNALPLGRWLEQMHPIFKAELEAILNAPGEAWPWLMGWGRDVHPRCGNWPPEQWIDRYICVCVCLP